MTRDDLSLRWRQRQRKRLVRPQVPLNMMFDILYSLPSRSLVRFKSVCKSWHSLISNHHFVESNLQLQKEKSRVSRLPSFLVVQRIQQHSSRICFHMLKIHAKRKLSVDFLFAKDLSILAAEDGKALPFVIQHCDGLILLSTTPTQAFVCNPATRELLTLPRGRPDTIGKMNNIGFGFDRTRNKYKIVRYFYRAYNFETRTCSLGLEVFTLKRCLNSWRQVAEDPPYPLLDARVASVEGGIYFKIDNELHTSPPVAILRFDLSKEKYRVIHPPPTLSDLIMFREHSCLSEFQGHLCCLHYSRKCSPANLWMTKDFNNHVWTLKYAIHLMVPPDAYSLLTIHGETIFFYCEMYGFCCQLPWDFYVHLLSRDFSQTVLVKNFFIEYMWHRATSYVESIVPVGGE